MDFITGIKALSDKANKIRDILATESATRNSLIEPFFQLLGYDTSDPLEVQVEFDLGFGASKGMKIDYAIMSDNAPIIFIEAKWCGEILKDKHASQLSTYFNNSKSANFGVLTNGIIYRFYTDLESVGHMDDVPFLEFNLLIPKDELIIEIKKLEKANFNASVIRESAAKLKYVSQFKEYFKTMLAAPSDEFVKFFIGAAGVYTGVKNQNVIDKYRPWLSQALNEYIADFVKGRFNEFIDKPQGAPLVTNSKIVTTDEELQGYSLVQNILNGIVPLEDIGYKDCERYFAVLYNGKTTQWICRLELRDNRKTLMFPAANNTIERKIINSVFDIVNYKDRLIESLKRYL